MGGDRSIALSVAYIVMILGGLGLSLTSPAGQTVRAYPGEDSETTIAESLVSAGRGFSGLPKGVPSSAITVGRAISAFHASPEFARGEVTSNLEDELVFSEQWYVPFYVTGSLKGAIQLWDDEPLSVGEVLGPELAGQLVSMTASDKLLFDRQGDLWIVVSDSVATPMNWPATEIFTGSVALSRVQDWFVARYQAERTWPTGVSAGGGGPVEERGAKLEPAADRSRIQSPPWQVVRGTIAVSALIVLVIGMRWRARRRLDDTA